MLGFSAVCRSLEDGPFTSSVLTSRCHCFRHATRQDSSGKLQKPPGVGVNRTKGTPQSVRRPRAGVRLAAGRRWDWGGEALGKEAGERPTEPPGTPDLPGILALCRLVKTVAPELGALGSRRAVWGRLRGQRGRVSALSSHRGGCFLLSADHLQHGVQSGLNESRHATRGEASSLPDVLLLSH